jgi:hypothetical protein
MLFSALFTPLFKLRLSLMSDSSNPYAKVILIVLYFLTYCYYLL